MGKQTNIKLRGTVENIIYYQWKGIHCIRTVPARVRQTKPTKKAASDFGLAVKCSASLRSSFKYLFPEIPAVRPLIYAMDGAYRKWLQINPLDDEEKIDHINLFNELSFNEKVTISKVLNVNILVSRGNNGDVIINWPAFVPINTIKAPEGTIHIIINYVMVTQDLKVPVTCQSLETKLEIPYNGETIPAKEILLPNVTGRKLLAILGMSIRFYKQGWRSMPVNSVAWKPGGVAGSFYN